MAGGPGYFLVALDNGDAGIAKVSANQRPISVGGHTIIKSVYLGASYNNILGNWKQALSDIYPYAVGLRELPPPGAESAILGSGVDLGTLIQNADQKGAGILSKTPGNAEWDPAFTIIAGGLGGIVAGAVRAAGAGAAAAAEGGAGAAAGATGVGKAASALGTAADVAGGAGVAAAIWEAVTNPQTWLRALEILAGVVMIYMALRSLSGADPVGDAVKAVR